MGCADAYGEFVQEQVEAAKQKCADPIVLVEQRLDFSEYVPEGFGTGDCVIVGDGTLSVIDFKYGVGIVVEAEKNPQMIADHSAYLLGAKNGSKLRYDGLKGCTDYKKAAQIIKDGGYATSLTYPDAGR